MHFTDLFDQETRRLGLSRDSVLEALNQADRVQDQAFDGLVVRLFLRKEVGRDTLLLIIAQVQDQDQTIRLDMILRVLASLFNNIDILDPFPVLQLLAQRFGLVLRVGQRLARIFYQAEVSLGGNGGDPVVVMNPLRHDCIASSYVKVVPRDLGFVAKCALAFCIDRIAYESWLSHKPTAGASSLMNRQVTRIVPLDVAKSILARRMREPDSPDRLYGIELDLALQVVVRIMGRDWYDRVFSKLPRVFDEENPILLKHYTRVIGLGHFLNQLWREDDSNNMSDKIDELRQETFEHTYYELKIAAQFDRRAMAVAFLRREKQLKTPDFQVTSSDGFAVVECKRKAVSGAKIDSDLEAAAAQIEEYGGGPGIVFIEVTGKLHNKAIELIRNRALAILQGMKLVKLCIITNEVWTDEVNTIAIGGSVWPILVASGISDTIYDVAKAQAPVDWPLLSAGLPAA